MSKKKNDINKKKHKEKSDKQSVDKKHSKSENKSKNEKSKSKKHSKPKSSSHNKKSKNNKDNKSKDSSKSKKTKNKSTETKKSGLKLSSGQTKLLRIFWNIIFYVIMLFIIVGSLFVAFSQQKDKSFYGYRMFGVLTDSMVSPDNTIKKGGFRSGDILITKETKPEDIKVGDVITYKLSTNPAHKNTSFLTHRVVKIDTERGGEKGLFFTTQGDANKSEDMPISSKALIGKEVAVIPKLGGIISFVKENVIVSFIFIFSVLGFIWILKTYIFIDYTKNTKKRSTNQKK